MTQASKAATPLEGGPFNANVNDLAEVELHQNGNRVTVERFPTANHYKLQVEAFGRSVREGVPYPCPLEFVRGTQAMMDRVYDVAVEGVSLVRNFRSTYDEIVRKDGLPGLLQQMEEKLREMRANNAGAGKKS